MVWPDVGGHRVHKLRTMADDPAVVTLLDLLGRGGLSAV